MRERENWNKKREKTSRGGKRNERRKRRLLRGEFFFKTQKRAHTQTNKKRRERADHERLLRAREHVVRRRCVSSFQRVPKEKDKGGAEIGIFFGGPRDDFAPSDPTPRLFFYRVEGGKPLPFLIRASSSFERSRCARGRRRNDAVVLSVLFAASYSRRARIVFFFPLKVRERGGVRLFCIFFPFYPPLFFFLGVSKPDLFPPLFFFKQISTRS